MSEITGLRAGTSRDKQVRVFLDGRLAFSLQAEAAAHEGLQIGQVLSDSRVEALLKAEQFRRGLDAAMLFLSYRPRSEAEVRKKLKLRGFDDDSVAGVLARLKELGLVDDVAFVRFWKENRETFNPRSQRLTRLELQQKGVDKEIVDQVVDTVDDRDSAYRAACSRASRLPHTDYQAFRRRLGEFLRRRGFSYEVADHTVDQVWQEAKAGKGRDSGAASEAGTGAP